MKRERQTPRRLLAAAMVAVLLTPCANATPWDAAPSISSPRFAAEAKQASDASEDDARFAELIDALFGDDEAAAVEARYALLLAELDPDALVALATAAQNPVQLAAAEGIAKHQVLTRLRREELEDLEDDTVIVGFQFQTSTTAGQVGPGTTELVERFPFGALISSTTAGFPGYAYLRPGDMIVLIDGDPLPEDRLAAQQHVMDAVRAHTIDEPVAFTLIRDGELVELSVPLARAAALPKIYSARTLTRDLIDPFLFLWEEAWGTIKLDAGYDEDTE